jgi:methionyl-tRNA synthetase
MDFTWERFRSRYDSELANDLGNLVSRTTAMIVKFSGGVVGRPATDGGSLGALARTVRDGAVADMEAYAPQAALSRIWELVRRANTYIEEEKPWVLAKEDRSRLERVLADTLESIRQIAVLVWPVMPGKSDEILRAIGLEWRPGETSLDDALAWGAGWPDRISIEKAAAVFPKLSDEELASKLDAAEPAGAVTGRETTVASRPEAERETRMLSFDEFKKLDLRLARVVEARKVEGADKLLSLTVDLGGGDTRPMVAGIAERYDPESLLGKTIVVVANLEPAKIRGVESRAMLLAATGGDAIAVIVPDKDLPPGTKVS